MAVTNDTRQQLLNSALWYAKEKGFSVIPVRPDKKPYIKWEPYQKQKASPDQIQAWWEQYPGSNVGIVTGAISNLTVIDIDTEDGLKNFNEMFGDHAHVTPIALTPRGGQHRYFQHAEGVRNAAGFMGGCDIRSEGGYIIAPPSWNEKGAYRWANGSSISKVPISIISSLILEYITNSISSTRAGGLSQDITDITNYNKIEKGSRDEQLFHLANSLVKAKLPIQEVQYYVGLFATLCCMPPFPVKEIPIKIQSALQRAKTKARNIADEVREWSLSQTGYFFITDIFQMLQLITSEEKQAVRQQLHRMHKEGVIEKHGDRRGCYRTPERDIKFEDFVNVDFTSMDIRLPFGFERYVEIMPGDIITFAGVKNAGKTALALECVKLNMNRFSVYYFSKEIKKHGLHRRLSLHENIPVSDWNFKFCSDVPNFTDILQPNAVNIIDYLEAEEGEYYKMGSILAKIHANLKGQAIAIVFLQKHTGAQYAMGGEATEQKPVLVFNIDPQFPVTVLSVKKAKNWNDINPNGFKHDFQIVKGINLIPKGIWGPA